MQGDSYDVIVIGAGISGLSFAFKASQAGKRVLVLEATDRIGGCFYSARRLDHYWFEMGAHTVYNSYAGFCEIAAKTGVADKVLQRGPARARFGFLRNGRYKWLTPPKVLLELNWLEAAVHFPIGIFQKKEGQTVKSYYSKLIGRKNFSRVLSPFFAAVPSQSADAFPVAGNGSLFKKRSRREDFPRSFGFAGGLQSVCDAVAQAPGVKVETGVSVNTVRKKNDSIEILTSDGRSLIGETVAVAATVSQAADMLRADFSQIAEAIGKVKTVTVDTMGVVLPKEKAWMPECAFIVPADDLFQSVVTRDAFPDSKYRAFAFHFKAGASREQRLSRMADILRVELRDITQSDALYEKTSVLPAPEISQSNVIQTIDGALASIDQRLAVIGNYFAGLAIEDCVARAFSEWDRVRGK